MTSDHHLIVAESLASTYATAVITNISPIQLPTPNTLPLVLLAWGLYTLGALLPDVDSESSWLGRFIHVPVKHRTWTHSIWALIPFCVWAYFQPNVWWLVTGYVVHLITDMPSRMGICLFYPYPGFREYNNGARVKRGRHLWIYRTGSKQEALIASLVCIACIAANTLILAKSSGVL